eukprot:TRINITY_DN563_c0_g1_i4.p2 TRINITY_DN563_c0_g1~~TRINITY_DN563_c0_g1_i4.p2  ORF type:complete len:350 (+),score=47.52 TRINITY_DN563_c0_g1_i4:1994-3043(+)
MHTRFSLTLHSPSYNRLTQQRQLRLYNRRSNYTTESNTSTLGSNVPVDHTTKSNSTPVTHKSRSNYLRLYRKENAPLIKLQLANKKQSLNALLSERETILSDLETEFGIQKPEHWYSITHTDLKASKSGKLIARFFSMHELVKILYPEEKWVPGRFKVVPQGTWKDASNVRSYIQYLETQLRIKLPTDWYSVSRKQLIEVGAKGMLNAFSTLFNALSFAFPEIPWDLKKLSKKTKKTTQKLLFTQISSIAQGEVKQNYMHPGVKWDKSRRMELDIWLPAQNLAVEYQGEQHYHPIGNAFGVDSSMRRSYYIRDEEKKLKCAAAGIKLVTVPYWWDCQRDSLLTLIIEAE